MKRSLVVRLQLVVLAILAVLLLTRVFSSWRASEPERAFVEAPAPTPPPVSPAPPPAPGAALLSWTSLGNDQERQMAFELDAPSRLHIRGLGEITLSGQYDYGWVERADTGERVWEMTLDNTQPAGGDERNRLYNRIVKLPPGAYVARFVTDSWYAYGDFEGGEAPRRPEDWGLVIQRLDP